MALDKVLIIEDEPVVRSALRDMFTRQRVAVTMAPTIAEANTIIGRAEAFDLVLLDVGLPDGNGHDLIPRLIALPSTPLVVVITGQGTIESAVAALRAGAYDYLAKPFSPSQLEMVMRKARGHQQLRKVNRLLSDPGERTIIGNSPAILRLREMIARVATTDATVFINGESGTGKEMVAREIYRRSPRRDQPFIPVNCAVVSETLMESEFFGHEKGAFTGATDRRDGRFELANNGTLLLDEVSEISPALQAKLLRVLQEREFERVGGNKTIKVNVRILATSNRDLQRSVDKGQFRSDLYHRLHVFPVAVPALRERREDIPMLADYFLQQFARKHGIAATEFTAAARRAMDQYYWPGNVRELQNSVERAVILSRPDAPIDVGQLGLPFGHYQEEIPLLSTLGDPQPAPLSAAPALTPAPAAVPDDVLPMTEVEKRAICSALERFNGNRTHAAKALQISLRSLRQKLREYGVGGADRDDEPGAMAS